MYVCAHGYNQDTNGAEENVLFSEISSFQRLKGIQEWYLGWENVSPFREVSSVQGCSNHRVGSGYIEESQQCVLWGIPFYSVHLLAGFA